MTGLYPIVGWKIGNEVVYGAKGHSSETATVIDWHRNIGLPENYEEIGVFFPHL